MGIPGLNTGKTPILKYNGAAGTWQVDGQSLSKITFVIDLPNAEAGWSRFIKGQPPIFVTVRVVNLASGATPFPLSPDERNFSKTFRAKIKLADGLVATPTVREWTVTSFAVLGQIDAVFDDWAAERADHPGELPIVACEEYEQIEFTGRDGDLVTSFTPKLAISGWTKRPRDLPDMPMTVPDPAAKAGLPAKATEVAGKTYDDLDDEIPF
jgi:hypothetical protein